MASWRLSPLLRSRIAGASSAEAFRSLLRGTSVLAALTHGAFGVLFWLSGVPLLAWVNVASLLLYGLCFRLLGRGRMLAGLLLMGTEVIGHAVLAVILVGWDSGFHYYFMLLVPVVLVSTETREWIKWAVALAVMAGYLALDVLCRQAVPPYALSPRVLDGLHYFNIVSALVILAFLTATYFRLVTAAEGRLRELATTDPLTRLLNRRALRERIALEDRRQQREPKPLSFVLADVDHFKAINDQHGHEVGDQVLVRMAAALSEGVREVDHLARWGGEEFLIVLPDTDEASAAQVAERLRQAVARLRPPDAPKLAVTATLGVAQRSPDESPDQAISRADQALYAGKRAGRDRVVRASDACQ